MSLIPYIQELTRPLRSQSRPVMPYNLSQPQYSSIIGTHSDGKPFFMDHADPSASSVLFIGFGGERLVRNMVQSVNGVEVLHISDDLAEAGQNIYTQFVTPAETLASYDDRALAEAYEMSNIANQRRSGRERGAYKLLAVDSLDDLYRRREPQTEAYLLWLISDGPAQGISVAAACSPEFPIRAPGWASPFARTMQVSGGGRWRYNYNGEYHEVRA